MQPEKTPEQEDHTKPLAEKCSVCGKEGWTGHFAYPNGELKNRLFLLLNKKVLCEKCLDQRSNG